MGSIISYSLSHELGSLGSGTGRTLELGSYAASFFLGSLYQDGLALGLRGPFMCPYLSLNMEF